MTCFFPGRSLGTDAGQLLGGWLIGSFALPAKCARRCIARRCRYGGRIAGEKPGWRSWKQNYGGCMTSCTRLSRPRSRLANWKRSSSVARRILPGLRQQQQCCQQQLEELANPAGSCRTDPGGPSPDCFGRRCGDLRYAAAGCSRNPGDIASPAAFAGAAVAESGRRLAQINEQMERFTFREERILEKADEIDRLYTQLPMLQESSRQLPGTHGAGPAGGSPGFTLRE